MVVDASGNEIVEEGAEKPGDKIEDKSLLDGGDAGAGPKTPEEIAADTAKAESDKVAAEAESKRILETEDANLSAEELAKKPALVKAAEEKRLLETPEDQLSAEDKVAKAALLKAQEDAKKGKEGAPEKYEAFKLPAEVEANPLILDEFTALAKELDLNQEKAQKLVDLQVKNIGIFSQAMQGKFQEIKDGWKVETKKALGPELQNSLVTAGKAIEKLGTPGLREMLNQTGVGNHPELVAFFVKVGKLVSEDKVIDGKNKSGQKSDAELFYGSSMK